MIDLQISQLYKNVTQQKQTMAMAPARYQRSLQWWLESTTGYHLHAIKPHGVVRRIIASADCWHMCVGEVIA
eukprot:scaffold34664_cov16-Prasinocladus_malaysianus.AAC.3